MLKGCVYRSQARDAQRLVKDLKDFSRKRSGDDKGSWKRGSIESIERETVFHKKKNCRKRGIEREEKSLRICLFLRKEKKRIGMEDVISYSDVLCLWFSKANEREKGVCHFMEKETEDGKCFSFPPS
jgi:hypothetical protein